MCFTTSTFATFSRRMKKHDYRIAKSVPILQEILRKKLAFLSSYFGLENQAARVTTIVINQYNLLPKYCLSLYKVKHADKNIVKLLSHKKWLEIQHGTSRKDDNRKVASWRQ